MEVTQKYRTIFLSDVHLGTRGCQAELLLDFLKHSESDTLYLVGDIIDGWRIKKGFYWPQSHNDVIQKLLRKARKGTKVYYMPGNHDEALRPYVENQFGGVTVVEEIEHETAAGLRLLVLHGDKYDGVVRHARWLALLGESAHNVALIANHWLNVIRRKLGLTYWSLSSFLKQKVKNAVVFMTNFKLAAVTDAHSRGYDGIVCGHLHHAETHNLDGVQYLNCGDWVENCTALVEHFDGRLEIVHWDHVREAAPQKVVGEAVA